MNECSDINQSLLPRTCQLRSLTASVSNAGGYFSVLNGGPEAALAPCLLSLLLPLSLPGSKPASLRPVRCGFLAARKAWPACLLLCSCSSPMLLPLVRILGGLAQTLHLCWLPWPLPATMWALFLCSTFSPLLTHT
jgi:hypothetical protein